LERIESLAVSLSLAGKVALVTGGSRGIGAETVRLFSTAGARVAFNYQKARAEAELLAQQCGGEDRCIALQQGLATPEEGRLLVERTVRSFGRLDCLVVNHGIWPSQDVSIAAMQDSQWRHTMGVNLDSVFGLVQAAVKQMKGQRSKHADPLTRNGGSENDRTENGYGTGEDRGYIVLVSSTAGQRGEAFHADYAVTKGAIISLTKSLSSELARDGIRVNCVAPGWVATDMSKPALNDSIRRKQIFSTIPLGRVATPTEIAGPILFLCTPYAGFMSGEIVNVNGGAVLIG
jgi:3-oxoacyl-[acyl-carrier protein] reductase